MSSSDRSWVKPVGGLTEIAFDLAQEYVLVVSASGRGLYELSSGERVARDYAQPRYDSDWLDERHHRVRGIGPLESYWLDAVGLWGGTLDTRAGNAWLSRGGDSRAEESIVLHTENGSTTVEQGIVTEIRAFGFARDGQLVVVATSSDLSVFAVSPNARLQPP